MSPGDRAEQAGRLLGLGARSLVLASASPRRAEILGNLALAVEVRPTQADETPPSGCHPFEVAAILAERKARAALRSGGDALVVGADTLVLVDGEILGKPEDSAEAAVMLSRLSGREHDVATGVAVISERTGTSRSGTEVTQVHFRRLSPADIEALVLSGESLDKAGGYGIQGLAALAVDRIEGDYFNVVGLPLALLRRLLVELLEGE